MRPLTDGILQSILTLAPEVEYAAIVTFEGSHIASVLPQGVDETKISAIIAALLSLSKSAVEEINMDKFDTFFAKGSNGYLLILQAGPKDVLAVSTSSGLRIDLISKIKEILKNPDKFGADYGSQSPFPEKPPDPPT